MSTNFPGTVLYGHSSNRPVFGQSGRLLHASMPFQTSAVIVVDWGDLDVDICAHWVGHGGNVGYSHGSTSDADGYKQLWESSDNIDGGPERVVVGYSAASFPQDATWRVHLNWYNGGPGPAEVTVKPPAGNPVTITAQVANRGGPASATDPGIEVVFNSNGTIKSLTNI